MDFRKNFLVAVSLSVSMVGLLMIYVTSKSIDPESFTISEIDDTLIGKLVSVKGFVVSKSEHDAGHIFLTISDGRKRLQVPIFSSVAEKLDSRFYLSRGQEISVTGNVDEYRGQLQIIPRKPDDINVLSRAD